MGALVNYGNLKEIMSNKLIVPSVHTMKRVLVRVDTIGLTILVANLIILLTVKDGKLNTIKLPLISP